LQYFCYFQLNFQNFKYPKCLIATKQLVFIFAQKSINKPAPSNVFLNCVGLRVQFFDQVKYPGV